MASMAMMNTIIATAPAHARAVILVPRLSRHSSTHPQRPG
jgi:hypothetical protein